MKKLKSITFVFLLLFSLSCAKEEPEVFKPEALLGTWTSELITINGVDGNEFITDLNTSTSLAFVNSEFFYRNYILGKWSVKNNEILIEWDFVKNDKYRNYKIVLLNKNKLIITYKTTVANFNWGDFDQFESDHVLTIEECYTRNE